MRSEHQFDPHGGDGFDDALGGQPVEQLRPGRIRILFEALDLVVLLRDVREIEKLVEGGCDIRDLVARYLREVAVQFRPRTLVSGRLRQRAYGFDTVEEVVAAVALDDLAEEPAKQPHGVPETRRCGVFGRPCDLLFRQGHRLPHIVAV